MKLSPTKVTTAGGFPRLPAPTRVGVAVCQHLLLVPLPSVLGHQPTASTKYLANLFNLFHSLTWIGHASADLFNRIHEIRAVSEKVVGPRCSRADIRRHLVVQVGILNPFLLHPRLLGY